MANTGAKKRRDENQRHMRRLLYVILASTATFVLLRLLVFRSSTSWKHYVGLLLTSGVFKLSYDRLNSMAQPSYGDNGELIDGGFDMSTRGLCEYIHDVIYITAFVQVASVVSDKFWFLYLVIPSFALYKLWQLFLYPFIFQGSSEDEPEDEKARKKREKQERKANRVKYAKVRTR